MVYNPYANHGAGIFTNICPCPKSPSFVGKYTSTMVRIWVCWVVFRSYVKKDPGLWVTFLPFMVDVFSLVNYDFYDAIYPDNSCPIHKYHPHDDILQMMMTFIQIVDL
jgi:hypothetical protein